MSNFIGVSELAKLVADGHGETLIACQWGNEEGAGYRRFVSHHIPTSVFCDPAMALAGVPGSRQGRNPLPDADQLARWFDRWGLHSKRQIVVYDEGHGLFASRAWWILRWAGVEHVRILDGGQKAWDRAGNPLMGGPGNLPLPSDLTPQPAQMHVATLEEVMDFDGVLIDARQPSRFAGKRETLDLKAGHIPGAINVPVRAIKDENDVLLPAGEIRSVFERAGVPLNTDPKNIIVYSGSGNHSAQLLAAMEDIGLGGAAHYVGGWSQWAARKGLPVERGNEYQG